MDDSRIKDELSELISNWVYWLSTRRFYAPALPLNILAILQKDDRPSREPPNAFNDAMCAAFNLIIEGAIQKDPQHALPFLYVYLKDYRPGPVKELAYALKIDADTVYFRAHKVAPVYLDKAKELAEMSAKIHREVDGFVD
jgi:hypothetical protein